MELRQLRYFEAVLETGTFTGAAAKCRVAQPALWAQVRAEQEWELALFERAGRRVRPTASALALRPLVRVLIGNAANIGDEVQRLRTGESGVVRLGTSAYQLNYFLAQALARYTRAYPSAPPPVIVPIQTADPYRLLAEGQVDLVSGTHPKQHGFQALPLYKVWLVATGKNVQPGPVEITDLRNERLALFPQGFASRRFLESEFARAGLKPGVFFEDDHADGLIALAREGLATAVVVNEALPAGLALPVAELCAKGKPLEFQLALMWREEATLSPSARRLRDTIVQLAEERRNLPTEGAPRALAGGARRRPPAARVR
jgi:DNA-binding transcriptional LysR family regulator